MLNEEELKDHERLQAVIRSEEFAALPPVAFHHLVLAMINAGAVDESVALLRRAWQWHPGDVRINQTFADFYLTRGVTQIGVDEALRHSTAAVALCEKTPRPGVWLIYAGILKKKGMLDESIAAYRESIRLKPDYSNAILGWETLCGTRTSWTRPSNASARPSNSIRNPQRPCLPGCFAAEPTQAGRCGRLLPKSH